MGIKHPGKIFITVILLFVAAAGTLSLIGSEEPKKTAVASESALACGEGLVGSASMRPIPTAIAKVVERGQSRVFPGKVRANRRAELSFSVGGKLVELNAQEGSRVKKGQVLARLDQRDFLHERDSAKARFLQAERNLDKYSSLHEQRVVTKTQFEDVQTAYDIALADLNIRQKALADTTLSAPFDGVVVSRHAENFGCMKKDEKVLSLQDISMIEVIIQVPERLLAREGAEGFTKLQVHFDGDRETDRWFAASVHEYSVESDKTTRTYDVVVGLASPADLQVFPGMTASVRTIVDNGGGGSDEPEAAPITLIPLEAVWNGVDGGSYVWVIAPEGGHPETRKVELGSLRGDYAEIVSGLEPEAHVAIAGVHILRENALVRPQAAGKEGLDG